MKNYKYQRLILLSLILVAVLIWNGTTALLRADAGGNVVSFSIPVRLAEATVHAGPGTQYYQTMTLKEGELVEVFLKNNDGWCAIRPPEGSFSWINARFVRKESDKLGTVRSPEQEKEVPVRVGSPSIMKSSVIQVGLRDGKQIGILGEMTLPGGTTWYKINPPAGEFRWIHENVLLQDETLSKLPPQLTMARRNLQSMTDNWEKATNSPKSNSNSANNTTNLPNLPDQIPNSQGLQFGPRIGNQAPQIPQLNGQNSQLRPNNQPKQNTLSAQNSRLEQTKNIELAGGQLSQDLQMNGHIAQSSGQKDLTRQNISNNQPDNSVPNAEPRLAQQTVARNTIEAAPPVSAEEFYLELSKLSGDYFNAADKNAGQNTFEALSDRCALLFQAARDDEQRTAAKLLYDNIERSHQSAGSGSGNKSNDLDRISFQNPTQNGRQASGSSRQANDVSGSKDKQPNRFQRMEFAFSTNSGLFKRPGTKRNEKGNSDSANGISKNRSANDSSNDSNNSIGSPRRSLGFSNGPNLVPPPSYDSSEKNNNSGSFFKTKPSIPELNDSVFAQAEQNNGRFNRNTVTFENNTQNIRQVAAVVSDKDQQNDSDEKQPDYKNKIARWRVPGSATNNTTSVRKANASNRPTIQSFQAVKTREFIQSNNGVNGTNSKNVSNSAFENSSSNSSNSSIFRDIESTSNNRTETGSTVDRIGTKKSTDIGSKDLTSRSSLENNGFDAVGRLGYFPDRPNGYPMYALVNEEKGKRSIICYIEAESGESLDRFVGQTIGIKGKKGIFKSGSQIHPFYSARTVFSLK